MMRVIAMAMVLSLAFGGCRDTADTVEKHSAGEVTDAALPDTVRVTPEAIERSGIVVGTVEDAALETRLEIPAEVQLDPDRVVHVTTHVDGHLEDMYARLGDQVKKGQVLARLHSVDIGAARASVRETAAALELAQQNAARKQALHAESIGSLRSVQEAQEQLSRAQAARAAAKQRMGIYDAHGGKGGSGAIAAPLTGEVIERRMNRGEVVTAHETLYVVADLHRVWVVGHVYEQDVTAVRVGAPVDVTISAYPGREWTGTLVWAASALDERTRTLPVRVELDNPEGVLRPGLFGTILLSQAPQEGAQSGPVLPEDALVRVGNEIVVFVPTAEPGTFRTRAVQTGERAGGRVAVEKGLQVGDRVVTHGTFVLKSEMLRGHIAGE